MQRALKGDVRSRRELTWGKRLDMLRDIAAGMHYLHTRRPAVIHGVRGPGAERQMRDGGPSCLIVSITLPQQNPIDIGRS